MVSIRDPGKEERRVKRRYMEVNFFLDVNESTKGIISLSIEIPSCVIN